MPRRKPAQEAKDVMYKPKYAAIVGARVTTNLPGFSSATVPRTVIRILNSDTLRYINIKSKSAPETMRAKITMVVEM